MTRKELLHFRGIIAIRKSLMPILRGIQKKTMTTDKQVEGLNAIGQEITALVNLIQSQEK